MGLGVHACVHECALSLQHFCYLLLFWHRLTRKKGRKMVVVTEEFIIFSVGPHYKLFANLYVTF